MGNISSMCGAIGNPQPEAHATGSDSAENILLSLISDRMLRGFLASLASRRVECSEQVCL